MMGVGTGEAGVAGKCNERRRRKIPASRYALRGKGSDQGPASVGVEDELEEIGTDGLGEEVEISVPGGLGEFAEGLADVSNVIGRDFEGFAVEGGHYIRHGGFGGGALGDPDVIETGGGIVAVEREKVAVNDTAKALSVRKMGADEGAAFAAGN